MLCLIFLLFSQPAAVWLLQSILQCYLEKHSSQKDVKRNSAYLYLGAIFFITFVLSEDDCEQNSEGRQIAENLTDTLAQKSADCDEVQSLKVRYAVSYLICSIKRRGVYQIF